MARLVLKSSINGWYWLIKTPRSSVLTTANKIIRIQMNTRINKINLLNRTQIPNQFKRSNQWQKESSKKLKVTNAMINSRYNSYTASAIQIRQVLIKLSLFNSSKAVLRV